ncbi:unnamed protein product, partial [Rotaria sordida]
MTTLSNGSDQTWIDVKTQEKENEDMSEDIETRKMIIITGIENNNTQGISTTERLIVAKKSAVPPV